MTRKDGVSRRRRILRGTSGTLRLSACLNVILLIIFRPVFTTAQPAGDREYEFVESSPLETALDIPEMRNTAEVWLEMINAAAHTLDIEQFYVANKPGESLDTVVRAIVGAARRGVRVRLLVDGRMYRTYPETVDSLGKQPGITARVIDYGRLAGGVQHAKFFVVDGQSLFIGSQNFDWRSLIHIRELGLRIRHDATVQFFACVFETDWLLAEKDDWSQQAACIGRGLPATPFLFLSPGGDTAWVTPTGSPRTSLPDTLLWDEPQIVRLIDGAQQELCLQFLSYSRQGRDRTDYPILDDALRRAAGRGVRVRMVVSDWEKATPAEATLKALSARPNIEVRFSVIPEWSGGYIPYGRVEHCKFILADGKRFWLGTSNGEKSYFHTSRNVGVLIDSKSLGSELRRFFMKGWDGPYLEPVTEDGIYRARRHGGE